MSTESSAWTTYTPWSIGRKHAGKISLNKGCVININLPSYPSFRDVAKVVIAYDQSGRIALRPASDGDDTTAAVTRNGYRGANVQVRIAGVCKILGYEVGTVFAVNVDGDMLILTPTQP